MTNLRERIVIPSWQMILHFSSIKKFNFFPSLIATVWLFIVIIYQITFAYVYTFNKSDEFWWAIASFSKSSYFFEWAIIIGVIFLFYYFLIPIAEGAILEMIHSYRSTEGKRAYRWLQWFFYGLKHFLELFELHNMLAIFKPLSIVTFYLFLLRMAWWEYSTAISVAMACYLLLAFSVNILFAYARFYVVFQDKGALESLSASTSMALNHINITIRLYFTLLLVYLRTVVIALIFIFLPFILSAGLAFITATVLQVLFIVCLTIVTLLFLIFITHFSSVLDIFVEGMWYEAYMRNLEIDADPQWSKNDGTYDATRGRNTELSYPLWFAKEI